MSGPTAHDLAVRWAERLAGWGIPDHVIAAAPESPWFHDPATFAVDDAMPTDTPSYRAARSALGDGGTVIDVGVGGGRSSLGLAPAATHVTGVDSSEAMLERFDAAATSRGVAHRLVRGTWPSAASAAGVADVVICHHVLYNASDILDFIRALTESARRRVVVELTESHPQSRMNDAWLRFHGLRRPDGPTAEDAVDLVRSLGMDVTVERSARSFGTAALDPATQAPLVRRSLCLSPADDDAVAAFLAEHPLPFRRPVVTLFWPGVAGR